MMGEDPDELDDRFESSSSSVLSRVHGGRHTHSKLVPLFVMLEGGVMLGGHYLVSLLSLPYLSLPPPPPPPLSLADGELGWFGALSRTAESGKLKATAYLGTAHHDILSIEPSH